MRLIATILSTALLAAVAQAGPLDPTVPAPQSNWLMHLDAAAVVDSQLGRGVLDDMANHGLDHRMQGIVDEIGINPLTDVESLTMFGKGFDPSEAVMVVDLTETNLKKLEAKAVAAEGYRLSSHRSHSVHSWMQKVPPHRRKMLPEGVEKVRKYAVVFRSPDQVRLVFSEVLANATAVVDRLETDQPIPPAPITQQAIPAGTYFTAIAQNLDQQPIAKRHPSVLVRVSRSLKLFAGESDQRVFLEMTARTISNDAAEQLMQVARGMLAMAQMTEADQSTPMSRLAGAVKLDRDQQTVTARFDYDAKKLHEELHAMRKAHRPHP
jgi:hypothetical protein